MSTENLRATLAAYTPLTALVGSRISSDRAEQTTVRPFVIFDLNSTEYIGTLSGDQEVLSESFDIACFSDRRVQADAVADEVVAALIADGQRVEGRSNDFVPDLDIHVVNIRVTWMD